jgi:hypothetical protein
LRGILCVCVFLFFVGGWGLFLKMQIKIWKQKDFCKGKG